MFTNFKPGADRVLVKLITEEEPQDGLIMSTKSKNKPQKGEIVAVGYHFSEILNENDPLQFTIKDIALFHKALGVEIEDDYFILNYKDILGVFHA